jgi:methyl-accepting chemotaxis protein
MATESAEDSEVSVSLPPDLKRWLDEQSEVLGIDPEEVLIRFLDAYRTAAEESAPLADIAEETDLAEAIDSEALLEAGLGERIDERTDSRVNERLEDRLESELEGTLEDVESLHRRVEDIEAEHEENVEDIRSRVLQLRDAVQKRAKKDHTRGELRQLSGRMDSLSESLDGVGTDVATLSDTVADADSRLDEVESKLERVARVLVALRRRLDELDTGSDRLEEIQQTANRQDVAKAVCESCDEPVRVGLLNEPFCPHCEGRFDGIERPESILGRFRAPRLTTETPPEVESPDE